MNIQPATNIPPEKSMVFGHSYAIPAKKDAIRRKEEFRRKAESEFSQRICFKPAAKFFLLQPRILALS
jgi:hypothetical protein